MFTTWSPCGCHSTIKLSFCQSVRRINVKNCEIFELVTFSG